MMVSYKKSRAGVFDVGVNETTGYNFIDEDVGESSPTGWTNNDDASTYIYSEVQAEHEGHLKVIAQYDNGTLAGDRAELYHDWGSAQSYGCVEFYGNNNDPTGGFQLLLFELQETDSTSIVYMQIRNGIYVKDGAAAAAQICAATPSNWHHISIEWNNSGVAKDLRGDGNLADGQFRVYVNGTEIGDYDLTNAADPQRIVISTYDAGALAYPKISGFWDAIAFTNTVDWMTDYSIGDNLLIEDPIAIGASSVLRFVITHEIMGIPMAEVMLEESEIMGRGDLLQCTDNYSVGGATASNIIFEGMVVGRTLSHPYSLQVVNRASELAFLTVADSYTNDSDGIMSDLITAACDYVTAGTLTDGADMGTITYSADKNLYTIFRDLAFFEGWIWYLKNPVQKTSIAIDFNDGTTDTGVSFTQLSNIWDFGAAKAGRYYTKVEVRGDLSSTGSASSSATDILNYGTNVFPYRDSALNTNALCNTAAANILDVLDNDPIIVHFKYQDATVGFIQPGQYITLGYSVSGVDVIPSQTFIVTKIVYDAVSGVGELWGTSSISYDLKIVNAITEQLPQANSDLIVSNNTLIGACLSYDHYIQLQNKQNSGTDGGGYTNGAFRKVPLNTEVTDTGGHCSLAANVFTLEAGTYYIQAWTVFFGTGSRNQCRLQNTSDASTEMYGSQVYLTNTEGGIVHLSGVFTIAASKNFEFQFRATTTKAGNGFGVSGSFGDEVYANVELWKIG